MKNFEDKVVVVTGAGAGMGRAYALEFARLGARLALNDYDAKSLAETVAAVTRVSARPVHSMAFDVAEPAAMAQFAATTQQKLGKAHVIINNAGIAGAGKPVWATPVAEIERVMNINFYGVVHGTQAFLPQLLANGEGAVVNVSSIFGLVGPPNHCDYSAAKFAVRGFTEALMVELHDSPISVHLVHPGGIATHIADAPQHRAFAAKYLSTPPEALVRRVIRGIRRGTPRIVYGKDALKTWLGATFVPLRLLNGMIWRDMREVIDRSDYAAAARAAKTSAEQTAPAREQA